MTLLAHTPIIQIYDRQALGGIHITACKSYTGTYIVKALQFPFHSLWKPALMLVGFILVFILGNSYQSLNQACPFLDLASMML